MLIDQDAGETIRELFEVPRDARDAAWQDSFEAAIRLAPFVKLEGQIQQGPDDFPYLVLTTPKDEPLEALVSVGGIVEECTERGLGVVIDPGPHGPAWVFHYGQLWSLREYDSFRGDPQDEPAQQDGDQPAEQDRAVMVGQPSERMLPPYARRVLNAYLHQAVGVPEPKVFVLVDPTQRPSRNLVFNVHPENFREPGAIQSVLNSLSWFLPPGRGLVATSVHAGFDDAFEALVPA